MKRALLFLLAFFAMTTATAFAGSGHYGSGGEGLQAATMPPPGLYWKTYVTYYNSSDNRDRDGHKANGDFSLNAASLSNRIIYSSDIELLGGNLVMDAVVPISYTDISTKNIGAASYSKNKSGVGDVILEPFILAWHGAWYDALIAAAVFLPTGDYNMNNPASIGKGYTTFMPSVGGTVYLDAEKTWHASILARYEMHTEQDQTHITPGNDFHFEWGAGKKFADIYNLGLVGYCHWQVTDDSGTGATDARKQGYALGPEFNFAIPSYNTSIAVRVLKEFEAQNAPQGVLGVLTVTKAF